MDVSLIFQSAVSALRGGQTAATSHQFSDPNGPVNVLKCVLDDRRTRCEDFPTWQIEKIYFRSIERQFLLVCGCGIKGIKHRV